MKLLLLLAAFLVPFLTSCNRDKAYEKAVSLRIGYCLTNPDQKTDPNASYYLPPKYVTIKDQKQVEATLSALDRGKTEKKLLFVKPHLTVEFIYSDGTSSKVGFLDPSRLQADDEQDPNWGIIPLENERFYKKICECVSKAEGKPYP